MPRAEDVKERAEQLERQVQAAAAGPDDLGAVPFKDEGFLTDRDVWMLRRLTQSVSEVADRFPETRQTLRSALVEVGTILRGL